MNINQSDSNPNPNPSSAPAVPSASSPIPALPFVTEGTETSKIDVRISYRIIDLFSQGLYRSPTKAIEELVSNAFDAGATKVHVAISPDLVPSDATMAVIDNGTGMDADGLRQHWLIGVSSKRQQGMQWPKGRKQIGQFGIGKLATYVLANNLTHVTKCNGKYYATSMDYTSIPHGQSGGVYAENPVQLSLRELTESEARKALAPWLTGAKPGYVDLVLFGPKAETSWTVAIMSALKEMARELQRGRLRWVLATAMPLSPNFRLYLDGDEVQPSKLKGKKYGSWILGKSLKEVPSPAPDDLQVTEDASIDEKSPHRFGLTHPQLGRITGFAELYEDLLTGGKSSDVGRSHGFFVYVCERLINIDDEYFGIDSNLLRHGTFARFRMVVHIDRLNEELRSSRESIREGPLMEIARNVLRGVFNHARAKHTEVENEKLPGVMSASRIAATPTSLTRRPLVNLVANAFAGKHSARYTSFPHNLNTKQQSEFTEELHKRAESPEGLVRQVRIVETLSQDQGIAVFDIGNGILQINALHPYVAHFLDEYSHQSHNVPLELLAMSEVLLEAHLYELGLSQDVVDDALSQRDELLRSLSRSTGKRNARLVAMALLDSATNKDLLESELVAAFDSLGFDDAIKIGGSGKPDGYAEARLAATEDGKLQSYKITLEAKSKEKSGTKVSAKAVGISTIVRQREDHQADYAIVVGPDFPTTLGENAALAKEIKEDRDTHPGKGITLVRIEDMARLVRLAPLKRIGPLRLRELFTTCSLPQEAKEWIDKLGTESIRRPPYRELLELIAAEQKDMPEQQVEYGNIVTGLRKDKGIKLPKAEVIELCRALSKMAPEYVFARQNTVELTQRPDKIIEAISVLIRQYPEEEQKTISVPK